MEYISITEAAERLQVDRSTVWRWCQDGLMPYRRKGPRPQSPYEIPVEALENLHLPEALVERVH